MEENKCPECGAYHDHNPKCSLIDENCAKKLLIEYYDVWLTMELKYREYSDNLYKQIRKIKKEAEFWKGKFVVVKNENNKLRKKIKTNL
jgi:hypothetical protein